MDLSTECVLIFECLTASCKLGNEWVDGQRFAWKQISCNPYKEQHSYTYTPSALTLTSSSGPWSSSHEPPTVISALVDEPELLVAPEKAFSVVWLVLCQSALVTFVPQSVLLYGTWASLSSRQSFYIASNIFSSVLAFIKLCGINFKTCYWIDHIHNHW